MVFGFGGKALFTDPTQYSTKRKHSGPPVTETQAARELKGYDYIVIGVGTAGSVIAGRLSEDPNVQVLGLEAGGDTRKVLEAKIPLTFGKLFHGEHDWNYYTSAQPQVANRELYWPRGKFLGGSSSMNAMMSHQNSYSDFDEWRDEHGCEGWGYKDVQPYMRKSEKFANNALRPAIDLSHRGDSGSWLTGYSYLSEIGEKGFLGGCQEIGIPYNPDINTASGTLGCTRFQTFIDTKGQRSSAFTAYLPQNVLNRKNLDIGTGAYVTRIIFDTTDPAKPKATAVEFQTEKNGPYYIVHARKEIILCGGAINTPQTLLLSGIGPKEELQKHGIPVIKELDAVGKRLKDHFCTSGVICKAKPGNTLDYLTDDVKALPSLVRWMLTGGGPLTSNVGETAAFFRTVDPPVKVSGPKVEDNGSGKVGPDIEVIGTPLLYMHHGEETAPPGTEIFSFVPIGVRPKSHGSITLRSRSVFDHPIIDPKYWSDEADNDRNVLLVGLRVCLQIMRSKALQEYLDPVPVDDDPDSYWWPYSSSDINKITDDQLRRWMSRSAFTLYHPIGSARMGPDEKSSVVDLHCRVHGVEKLRIVDASIFPEQVSGHPTSPIIAIAERASDLIRGVAPLNGDASKVAPVANDVPVAKSKRK